MTLYETLLLLHQLAATIWLGGGLSVAIVALRTERSGDAARMHCVGEEVEWFGSRVLMPAALVVLVSGLALTWLGASFREAWIVIALVAYATSGVLALVFLGPRPGALAALAAQHGPTAAPVTARVRRHFLYNRIEVVLLIIVLVDMVLKPGREVPP
ncbi:MAG: DUF2269 family protein [Candidatus Binatia bacterium]